MLEEYKSHKQKQDVFSTYACINTISEFKKWYNSSINLQSKVYFRGINEAKYKNYTSVQRFRINNSIEDLPITIVKNQIEEIRNVNDELLEKYCKSIDVPCSDFYLMSLAQHYGNGISMFLDFTTNLDTALFFMCDDAEPNKAALDNSLENYCSIYFAQNIGIPFEDIIGKISSKLNISNRERTHDEYIETCRYMLKTLFSVDNFNILFAYNPIIIENKPYVLNHNDKRRSFSSNIIVSNFNIVAQEGCLLYYNEDEPLEKNLCCVDVHKSLLSYIKNHILKPNGKTKSNLFPTGESIVNTACKNLKF